jgi:hypothetical protein
MFSNGISGCHKNGCNGCDGKDGCHGCGGHARQGCGGKDGCNGCDGCHGNSIWSGRENYRGVTGCN